MNIMVKVNTKDIKQRAKLNQKDWPCEYICNFLEPGLVSYLDVGAGIAMLRKETILAMMPSFVGKPVIINHKDVDTTNFEKHAVGYVTRVWYDDYANWAYCSFLLIDDKAKESVAKGYSVSCSYDVESTKEGGEYHAIKYDEEIVSGCFTHLALVLSPRYEDCRVTMNRKNAKVAGFDKSNQKKEAGTMIQLFKKVNDKAGKEVDPNDPTKQKWNAETLYVKIDNAMVPLSELAKHAKKENEFEAVESVENEIEVDNVKYNVLDLISNYKQSKKNADDETEEDKAKKKEMAKKNAEDEEKKKKEEEDALEKKNAEDKKEKDTQEKEQETIKRNEKKDVSHFVKLNTLRDGADGKSVMYVDLMQTRIERGANRYGTSK